MILLEAASAAKVVVPWGDLLNGVIANIVVPLVPPISLIIITWVGAKLGQTATKVLQSAHADRMITQAADQALATVEGAEKGKTLEVSVANNVIREAAQWLVDNAPREFARIEKHVGSLIVAKLNVEASASKGQIDLHPAVVKTVANAQATKDID